MSNELDILFNNEYGVELGGCVVGYLSIASGYTKNYKFRVYIIKVALSTVVLICCLLFCRVV